MPESSDSVHSSIFLLENICFHNFTQTVPNSLDIVSFVSIMDPRGPELSRNKTQNFSRVWFTFG